MFSTALQGLRVLAIYAYTFGSMSAGVIAGVWGAPWAANMSAALGIALVGILALFSPKLRNI
jgi:hypothetical protein